MDCEATPRLRSRRRSPGGLRRRRRRSDGRASASSASCRGYQWVPVAQLTWRRLPKGRGARALRDRGTRRLDQLAHLLPRSAARLAIARGTPPGGVATDLETGAHSQPDDHPCAVERSGGLRVSIPVACSKRRTIGGYSSHTGHRRSTCRLRRSTMQDRSFPPAAAESPRHTDATVHASRAPRGLLVSASRFVQV